MIRFPKIRSRRAFLIVGIWLLVITVPLLFTAFQLHWLNLRELQNFFGGWSVPDKGRKIVIFAPHCDDETLGVGGLIREASKEGAEIWVVLLTNGDGFRYAAAVDSRAILVRPHYFIDFGYRRQQETLAALKELGASNVHVVTLGYPDRGLEHMWSKNWSVPYRSPYTKDSTSRYRNAYTRNARYTGDQLLSDIEKLLKQVNPTDLYVPHPNDQHGDHWATSMFVTEALYDLGWSDKKDVAYYLVHRGDWPVPQGLHENIPLAPPAALADLDTDWHQFYLDEDTENDKKLAIEQFKSLKPVGMRFIRSFVRENELFGTRRDDADVEEHSGIKVDGKTAEWEGIDPVILDPLDDGIPAHSQAGADLKQISVVKDSDRFYFNITVRGNISSFSSFDLLIRPLGSSASTTIVTLKRGGRVPIGWKVDFGKKAVELSCPRDKWRGKPILLAVRSRAKWLPIDRSAYRVLNP